ncbi:hypothetical protein RJ641_013651 [Dillenia turbinata]|uniref:Uncharacterized protein n=1 Tax=Dillenia turbinata TaxID=194707 RepID=A0AAN8WHH7_9MAGN
MDCPALESRVMGSPTDRERERRSRNVEACDFFLGCVTHPNLVAFIRFEMLHFLDRSGFGTPLKEIIPSVTIVLRDHEVPSATYALIVFSLDHVLYFCAILQDASMNPSDENKRETEDDFDHQFVLKEDIGDLCRVCDAIGRAINTIIDFQYIKVIDQYVGFLGPKRRLSCSSIARRNRAYQSRFEEKNYREVSKSSVLGFNKLANDFGVDVLCSDKTGTLTLNKLTVEKSLIEKKMQIPSFILMAGQASCVENQDAIDAAIVGMLADPKDVDNDNTFLFPLSVSSIFLACMLSFSTSGEVSISISLLMHLFINWVLNLIHNKSQIEQRVYAVISRSTERGLISLAVASQETHGEGVNDAFALEKADISITVAYEADAAHGALDIDVIEPSHREMPGAIMTISKDRVKLSPLPDSWKLSKIFVTGIVLGSLQHAIEDDFRMLASTVYLQVSTISQALIFVTRTSSWSYVEHPRSSPRPGFCSGSAYHTSSTEINQMADEAKRWAEFAR